MAFTKDQLLVEASRHDFHGHECTDQTAIGFKIYL